MTHRKASLLCIAYLFLISGEQLWRQPPVGPLKAIYSTLLSIFTFHEWAAIWFFVGVLCVVGVAIGRRVDALAFTAAELLICGWATGLSVSFIKTHLYRGLLSLSIYYALALLFAIISGWPERVKDGD